MEESSNTNSRPRRKTATTSLTNEDATMDDTYDDEAVNQFINDIQLDDYDDDEDEYVFEDDDDELFEDESEEDDYDENYNLKDELKSASGIKTRNRREKLPINSKNYYKRKMTKADNRELDPEVRHNLSKAHEAFVRNDLQVAQNLYLEVIKKDPKNFSAYKTLGDILQRQGKLGDCCNYWLLAANLHPWDFEFWGQVAELSGELGHIDQAIYCYNRAISSDIKRSAPYIIERALIYKERKQYGKALDGFQKVRQAFPQDSNIVRHLASVYSEQKRLNDAINLYMKILDNNIHPEKTTDIYPKFDWAELNILIELYIQHHSYRTGLTVLKLATRWIQGRTDETFWDDNDDLEFDKVKRPEKLKIEKSKKLNKNAALKKPFELPIDIRFKLGCLRMGAGDKELALSHFKYLLADDQNQIEDLHFEAGKVLEENGYYEDALEYFTKSIASEEFGNNPELIYLLGRCLYEVGDYAQAKKAYETLLHDDPENLDYKLALAETIYYLGDDERAQELIREVQTQNQKEKKLEVDEEEEEEEFTPDTQQALIKSQYKPSTSRKNKLTEQEKEEIEANATRRVLEKYHRMEKFKEAVNAGDKTAALAWLQLGKQLIEMFANVKAFFPKDKNKEFKGILRHYKSIDNIDEKLARAYNLLDGIVVEENYSKHTLTTKTEYRGLSYDQWFDIFAEYAILTATYDDNVSHADEVLSSALNVIIFVQSKVKESTLRVLKILLGIMNKDFSETIATVIRTFLLSNQFSPFICKFFMWCFGSGIKAWEVFANYNHQKYFLRQLKSYDSIVKNEHINGQAQITTDLSGIKLGNCHPDLVYIYANLLGGSRSYNSSVFHLYRAYIDYDKDPMICLVLGLAHVHRSMQRLSENRHMQLLQGISYLLEYKETRETNATIYEIQEVEYNFGRLFHMIGLTTLAVRHYNKVLEMKDKIEDVDYDLSWEAAYNLTLIYNINGNPKLARDITEEYLVFD
ncbi:unnamed protein product [Candida verbasci]|uniref:TPR-like protein n=1 Tax=Candida verbasci TaxID=1227364 RepID=A0A9W4TWW0_9ASCO|nr:unnamed protein product [Candida verbasci]